ncbi:DUF3450 domain-containing protein [Aliikangiella sp. IMCC44653]
MLNRNKTTKLSAFVLGLVAILSTGAASAAGKLDTAINIETKIAETSTKSQKKINRFAEQTLTMAMEYKNTLRLIESLKVYNDSLEALIANQEQEMITIQDEIDNIDATERGVVPLMNEMIASLEKFIELDLPFKRDERLDRANKLKNNMLRADVATAEKYRHILAAYDMEIKYGEGFESYTGEISDSNNEPQQVEFLRFGRVLLVYLTLDGSKAGYWNPQSSRFEALDESYIRSIEQGIKMANKQASPELVKLPVPAATEAQ